METDDVKRPGAPAPGGGPDPDAQRILDFLATAPDDVRAWADTRAAEIRASLPVAPPPVHPDHDPADLALAELGEHDDEPGSRAKVHTPQDRPVTHVVQQRRSNALVPVLGIALVAALVYGIFLIGRPSDTAQPTMTTAPPANAADTTTRMAELERRLADNPEDVAVNLELGVLKFNEGDIARAEELWLKVTELDPRNPQAWFNLGFVHLSEDPPDVEGARADWEQVLAVAPDSDLAATVESHLIALDGSTASPTPTETEG